MPRDAAEAAVHTADGCAASGCAGGLAACGHQADTPPPAHLAIIHPAAVAWYSPYTPPTTESRPALTSTRNHRPPHPTPTPSAPTTVQRLHLIRALAKTSWYRPPNCVLAGCRLVPRWEEPHPATDLHIWSDLPLLPSDRYNSGKLYADFEAVQTATTALCTRALR